MKAESEEDQVNAILKLREAAISTQVISGVPRSINALTSLREVFTTVWGSSILMKPALMKPTRYFRPF